MLDCASTLRGSHIHCWPHCVNTTASCKRPAHRRPLKLTGWELWLCGETEGPLFAPDKDAELAAFSGAADSTDTTVTVVKKAVPSAANVDVDVLVRAGYRAAQIEQDLVSQVRVLGDAVLQY